MTVLQPTQYHRSATGESVTVLLPTQSYRRVSDCSTAHTVLQESQ